MTTFIKTTVTFCDSADQPFTFLYFLIYHVSHALPSADPRQKKHRHRDLQNK